MRQFGFCALLTILTLLATTAGAEIQWQDSIDHAKQMAGQSGRLVLVHFWSTSCMPCVKLEKNVYSAPGIEQEIGAVMVPVKINADVYPGVAQQYGIRFVPTDVVLAPDGRVLARQKCPMDRVAYVNGLQRVAASYTSQIANAYANINPAPAATQAQAQVAQGVNPFGQQVNQSVQGVADQARDYTGYFQQASRPPTGQVAQEQPTGRVAPLQQSNPYAMAPPTGAAMQSTAAPVQPTGAPMQQAGVTQRGSAPMQQQLAASSPAGPPEVSAGMGSNSYNENGQIINPYVAKQQMQPPQMQMQAQPQPQMQPQQQPQMQMQPQMQPRPQAQPQMQAQPPSQPQMHSPNLPVVAQASAQSGVPPLGLDGTCPVELVENERWLPGDPRWGAIHRGKLYLFIGPEQQKRFLANPDNYSPVLSGNDPVMALDRRQIVTGRREHGLFYDNRVFLFASEQSLAEFYRNPGRYAERIQQAEAAAGTVQR